MSYMSSQIVEKISERLNSTGIEVMNISMQEFLNNQVGSLSRPAINISVNNGLISKVTQRTYKNNLSVTLILIVSDLRGNITGENIRRKKVLDLIDAVIMSLFRQKLDLELQDPLIPENYSNITDLEAASAGYLIYQINFSCSYNFEYIPDDEKDLGYLKTIVCNYFLQDPSDDGKVDSSSQISLTGLDGGNAFSNRVNVIDGGTAGSEYEDTYDGGDSKTIY
jgi:hypothetical protein